MRRRHLLIAAALVVALAVPAVAHAVTIGGPADLVKLKKKQKKLKLDLAKGAMLVDFERRLSEKAGEQFEIVKGGFSGCKATRLKVTCKFAFQDDMEADPDLGDPTSYWCGSGTVKLVRKRRWLSIKTAATDCKLS